MKRFIRLFIICILILSGLSGPLFADTIILVNGDKLSGSIISMTENEIVIKTEYGTVKLDRSRVVYGLFGDEDKAASAGNDGVDSALQKEQKEKYVKTGPPLIFFPFSGIVSNLGSEPVTLEANTITTYGLDQDSNEEEAAYLKGKGEYIASNAPEKLINADEFTVRVTFKMFNPLKTQYLISMWKRTRGSKATGKFAICTVRGSCLVYLADTEGNYHTITAEGIISPLAWNDLVVSVGSSSIRIYINGKLSHESGRRFGNLQQPDIPVHYLTAVAGSDGSDFEVYNVEGYVAELSIWDYALTRQQVQVLE